MIRLIKLCIAFMVFCPSLALAKVEKQQSVVSHKYVQGKFLLGNSYNVKGKKYTPKVNHTYTETGIASWYGNEFRGRKTANGSHFTAQDYTAAHRTLPLPSVAKVTNLKNGKVVEVVINDRGPFNNRIIDLSHKAAQHLDFTQQGTTKIKVEYLHDKTLALLAMYPAAETKKALKTFHVASLNKDNAETILQ